MCSTQNAPRCKIIMGVCPPRSWSPHHLLKRTPCQLILVCTGAGLRHQADWYWPIGIYHIYRCMDSHGNIYRSYRSICITAARVLESPCAQDTQEIVSMLSGTPATPMTSPAETALPSAATSPTSKDTSQPGWGAVWDGFQLDFPSSFSLKGVFKTNTYMCTYMG